MTDSANVLHFHSLTWGEVEKMTKQLLKKIRADKEKFTAIIGIERGGVHISEPIAQALRLPHKTIKISFYKDGEMSASAAPKVNLNGISFDSTDHILFIDDLVDSGSTLKYVKTMLGVSHKFGGLFWNPKGKFSALKPDYYVEDKVDTWIQFPWEKA